MIKHFNTHNIYRQNNYNIYPERQLLAFDQLNSLCRYCSLEYLLDCTMHKHREKNNSGCIFILHLKFSGLFADVCADIIRKLIGLTDIQLSGRNNTPRDYIWFLKQKRNDTNTHASIIFFGDSGIFAHLDEISNALNSTLSVQKFLTGYQIDIPTLIPEQRKPLIMRHININDKYLLLDYGFASDFKSTEDIEK